MLTRGYLLSVTLITLAVLGAGALLWDDGRTSPSPGSSGAVDGVWQRGVGDAPVVIDVYPDFDCQVCLEKESLAGEALTLYPGEVRMVYHHFPNSELGEAAARALEAAGEQGRFWEMHDRLIAEMPLDAEGLRACAEGLGLDIGDYDGALASGGPAERVRAAKEAAEAEGIRHVSMFINGEEYVEYPPTLDGLCGAIDGELTRLETDGG